MRFAAAFLAFAFRRVQCQCALRTRCLASRSRVASHDVVRTAFQFPSRLLSSNLLTAIDPRFPGGGAPWPQPISHRAKFRPLFAYRYWRSRRNRRCRKRKVGTLRLDTARGCACDTLPCLARRTACTHGTVVGGAQPIHGRYDQPRSDITPRREI